MTQGISEKDDHGLSLILTTEPSLWNLSLVDSSNWLWQNLHACMRECSGGASYCKNRIIDKSNGNTYPLLTVVQYTIPNSMASTIVVQSSWKKYWPVHAQGISESILKLFASSQCSGPIKICGIEHIKHTEPSLSSRIPVFLNQKLPTRSAGRMPQGITSIRSLCRASWIFLLWSDDDSWCKIWLIGVHSWAHVHSPGICTPSWQLHESKVHLTHCWSKCLAKEFWTETWGNPVGYHRQAHFWYFLRTA